MFCITHEKIDTRFFKNSIDSDESGAVLIFEGVVRNHHKGRKVKGLEYEAMEVLATKEAVKIIDEAKEKFDVHYILGVHRVGKLNIGDAAIWIGVSASHRDDAFKACRYVIDEIKKRLPIWKKEYYTDGDTKWVNCSCAHSYNLEKEDELYSRQTILSDIGEEGQRKLKSARVLVVGAGGLGSSALMYLASAGVGTIGICEFDNLEASNLNRQTLYAYENIGQPKAQLAAQRINALNPFINVNQHPYKLDCSNIEKIAGQYDVILDCTDNFVTKFLLNDFAVLYKKKLILSSIYQYEGQIQLIHPQKENACLRCLWEHIPDQSCIGTCAEAGVLGVVPGLFGTLQATETLKVILYNVENLLDKTILFDLRSYVLSLIGSDRNTECVVCSTKAKIKTLDENNYRTRNIFDMDINDLSINDFSSYVLIDIRQQQERQADMIEYESIQPIPLSQFESDNPLSKDRKYLVYCVKGVRSAKLVQSLRKQGYNQVYSVLGGKDQVKRYLESEIFKQGVMS